MKKFQKIISLCLAVLLTVLSVQAKTAETFVSSEANTLLNHQVVTIAIGNRIIYAFDSSQKKISVQTESKVIPFDLNTFSVFNASQFQNSLKCLSLREDCKTLCSEANTSYKEYSKKLIFPFHSHW